MNTTDFKPFSFCHYCSHTMKTAVLTPDGYKCGNCGNTTWMNAVPVAVLIAPCGNHESGRKHGVFTVRRGIPPFVGQLALPGGFITHTDEVQETWQAAACREACEEIQIYCRNGTLMETPEHVLTESSYSERRTGDRVLIFGSVKGVFLIGTFQQTKEAQERVILFPDDEEQLCFSIHRKALAMHWDSLGVKHNVDLTDVR